MSVYDGRPPRRNPDPWPADRVPTNNLERLLASVPQAPAKAPKPEVPRVKRIATWQERVKADPYLSSFNACLAEIAELRAAIEAHNARSPSCGT